MREFTVTIWGLAAVALGHWAGGLDWVGAAFLANRTEGYAGADINGILDRMKQLAYKRRLKRIDRFLAEEVVSSTKPTDSREIREKIRAWEDGSAIRANDLYCFLENRCAIIIAFNGISEYCCGNR